MSDFEWLTLKQIIDFGDKVGGQARVKRFLSGELVLVERGMKVSKGSLGNGGVTYSLPIDVDAFRRDWERHFLEVYGFRADLSGLPVPELREGFSWGVVRLPELSAEKMINVLSRRFPIHVCRPEIDDSLDEKFEVRTTLNGPYVTWHRDRVEADEENKNLSANDLVGRGANYMTLPERIAQEGWFRWKTNGHLDHENITNCVGSRWLDGSVPSVNTYSTGVHIFEYHVDDRNGLLRAREAVSLSQ